MGLDCSEVEILPIFGKLIRMERCCRINMREDDMKSMRSIVFGALVVVALYCIVRLLLPGSQTPPQSTEVRREARSARPKRTVRSVEPREATGPNRQWLPSEERRAPSVSTPEAEPVKPEAQAEAGTRAKKTASVQGKAPTTAGVTPAPRSGKPPIQDPMARAALAYVGADPEAELYWYEAINDPALPAQERQDLIEDLNEDGLSDPHNPTMEDLPLILSRIQLIEEVVWDAMDEVNADAFLEAYKDLVNLAFQAMEDG
jgi:hypothetical protein